MVVTPVVPLLIALSQWDGWSKPFPVENPRCEFVEYRVNKTGTGWICIQTAKEWGLVQHPETAMWVTPESLGKNPRMHNDPVEAVVPRYSGPRGRHPGDRPQ